jgi:cell division protein FtsB
MAKKIRRGKNFLWIYIIGIPIILLLIFSLIGNLWQRRAMLKELSEVQQKYQNLVEENEELGWEIEALSENDDYLALQISEVMGMIKPGEVIYKVVVNDKQELEK